MALVFSNFGKSVCRGKSIPVNLGLYNKIKGEVKRKVKRWPSAYASGQLVRTYKQRGGKYSCSSKNNSFGNLDRWFSEKWVDVCTGRPCGRKPGSNRRYPYCRPSRRISAQTPRTSRELSRQEIKKRCAKKHRIKGETLKFGKTKNLNVLNLTNSKSILSFRQLLKSRSGCKSWNHCNNWLYFISKPINDIKNISFTIKTRNHQIDKRLSNVYQSYIKQSKGIATSFYSPGGTLLVIPRKGYINLMDFTFNASNREWIGLWKRVARESKKIKQPFYISTHGHGVNWLHIRLEKKLKY